MAIIETMNNGLIVALHPMPSAASVAIMLQARGGSRRDPVGKEGLYHFGEHMLFRGAGPHDSDALSDVAEDLGIDLNAVTSESLIRIEAAMAPHAVIDALTILSHMAIRPHMPADAVDNERDIIEAEIETARMQDNPVELHDALAFRGQGMEIPVPGTAKTIANITHRDLVEWASKVFTATETTLAVSGAFDADAVMDAIRTLFADLPTSPATDDPELVHMPGTVTAKSSGGQASVYMSWPAPNARDDGRHVAAVGMDVLGCGPSSRLFRRLRERDGLCYEVSAGYHGGRGYGMATVGFETTSAKGKQSVAAVFEEIARLTTDITERELARAKACMETSVRVNMDTPSGRASMLASRARSGESDPMREVDAVRAVSLADVRAFLATLTPERCAAANVGGGAPVLSRLAAAQR